MRAVWIVLTVVCVLASLLGALWLGQGVGLIHLKPIACVGDCRTVDGPSTGWALAGAVLLMTAGALALLCGRRAVRRP